MITRLAALLALLGTTLAAQSADWNTVKALTTGTPVRITAGPRTVRGEIIRATDDALVIASSKGQEMFDRPQVSTVSLRKLSHRGRNTLIGLVAGTGGGLGIGLGARAKRGQWELISNEAVLAAFTAAGAIVGTVVGVIIPSGGWREIYKK